MNEWNLLRRLHVHYRHRARYVCMYVRARSVAHIYLYSVASPSTISRHCARTQAHVRKSNMYTMSRRPAVCSFRRDARDEVICLSRVPCIYERNATMKATYIAAICLYFIPRSKHVISVYIRSCFRAFQPRSASVRYAASLPLRMYM